MEGKVDCAFQSLHKWRLWYCIHDMIKHARWTVLEEVIFKGSLNVSQAKPRRTPKHKNVSAKSSASSAVPLFPFTPTTTPCYMHLTTLTFIPCRHSSSSILSSELVVSKQSSPGYSSSPRQRLLFGFPCACFSFFFFSQHYTACTFDNDTSTESDCKHQPPPLRLVTMLG